jgi:hypothetical protein
MRRMSLAVFGIVAMMCFACKGNDGGRPMAGGDGVRPAQTAGNEGPHGSPAKVAGNEGVKTKSGTEGGHPARQGGVGVRPKAALAAVAP